MGGGSGQWSLITDLIGEEWSAPLALVAVVVGIVGKLLWMRR